MYDSSIPFTAEEINLIEGSGLTLAELIEFYIRFLDQNLDTTITEYHKEKQTKQTKKQYHLKLTQLSTQTPLNHQRNR